MLTPLQTEIRIVVKREGRRMRLRRLLMDGQWHTTGEVMAVGGSGWRSRLQEIREGSDGWPALDVVAESTGPDAWRYRAVGETIPGANLDGGAAEAPSFERCKCGKFPRAFIWPRPRPGAERHGFARCSP